MKQLIIMAMVLLLLAGCTCKRVDPVTKLETDNFSNCLTVAQELFCNPNEKQQAEAAAVLTFLTSGVQIASMVTTVPITADQVVIIFGMIRAGACVLTTDLGLAVAWYNELTSVIQAQVMSGKMKGATVMPPAIPDLQAQSGQFR
jgi:hypothetical protein